VDRQDERHHEDRVGPSGPGRRVGQSHQWRLRGGHEEPLEGVAAGREARESRGRGHGEAHEEPDGEVGHPQPIGEPGIPGPSIEPTGHREDDRDDGQIEDQPPEGHRD